MLDRLMNQCDGCRAGVPLKDGKHRMGKPGGYADWMICTKDRYGSFQKTIDDARKEVRKRKRFLPYTFVEYTVLQRAKQEYKEAKERLQAAQELWDNLAK